MTMSRLGVQSNDRMEAYLKNLLPVTRFEDLPIPFAAVATELQTGNAIVMRDTGDIPFAIRASCAIPGWYVPVTDEQGRQLVDGGLVANIPSVAARGLGADIVIAIDVNAEGAKFLLPSQSVIGVVLQSMLVVQRMASMSQVAHADIVIKPAVGHIRWDEIGRAEELIVAGYKAGVAAIPEIKQSIENALKAAPKWYSLRRRKEALTPAR
jgi:NTE family protein